MKNSLVLSSLLALAATLAVHADEPTETSVKFSHPDKPGSVRLHIASGSIRVTGTDSPDTITVKTEAMPEGKPSKRDDGLRVIGSSSSFSLVEKDNVVELNYGAGSFGPPPGAEFIVTVPRNASVEINENWGAEISVDGVNGDVEVRNMNGETKLTNMGGGAVVETMNGAIHAEFRQVSQNKPLSFTSINGEVELRIPGDTKANVRFRSQNGTILTDFPDDVLKTKSNPSPTLAPEAPSVGDTARAVGDAARLAAEDALRSTKKAADDYRRAHGRGADVQPPAPPRPPAIPAVSGGRVVSGQLNGGGVEIQVATMNGDIIVRRLKQ